jgi:hypothetical protein
VEILVAVFYSACTPEAWNTCAHNEWQVLGGLSGTNTVITSHILPNHELAWGVVGAGLGTEFILVMCGWEAGKSYYHIFSSGNLTDFWLAMMLRRPSLAANEACDSKV